jgi:hypothetical protein
VPVSQRARWIRQLRGVGALCLALLLALTPLAQLFPTLAAQAALAASAPSFGPDGKAPPTEEPTLTSQDDRSDTGILPRLLHLEGALAPPLQRAPCAPPARAVQPLVGPRAAAGLKPATGNVFHYSSIGTARTPTGPPV